MQTSIFVMGALVVLSTGQADSIPEACGVNTDSDYLDTGNSNTNQIECKRSTLSFLRSIPFSVDNMSILMDFEKAQCFYPVCCNRYLARPLGYSHIKSTSTTDVNYEGFIRVGASLDGTWSCIDSGQGIASTTAHCGRFEADGSGWNLYDEYKNNTLCTVCQAGSYLSDNHECESCPEGLYSDENNATECTQCPTGTYNEKQGSIECTTCLEGQHSNETGATACRHCPRGTYTDEKGATDCEPCRQGHYSNQVGATECTQCPKGTYNAKSGATKCQRCPQGHYSNEDGATECNQCPKGTSVQQKGATECQPCPKGQYSSETGATACRHCPNGTYTDEKGAPDCVPCRQGHYSNQVGATECTQCPRGTYTVESGATKCQQCPEGHYSNEDGATECNECPKGTYVHHKGATECQPCPKGQHSNENGATACRQCPLGTYTQEKGAAECEPCPRGHYSDEVGATECRQCPRGTFIKDKGATKCQPCPQGQYSNDGATACTRCPRGTYTEGEGACQCLYCPAGHTTYSYNPNVCVGPQLDGLDRSRRLIFTAQVDFEAPSYQARKAWYWRSIGDWSLLNKYQRKFAKITQKYTTSYRKAPRVIRKAPVTTAVAQIIKDVYCYTSNGENYRGYENKTETGKKCRGSYCTYANREKICYCRNKRPTDGHSKPYCTTDSGKEEDCDIPRCNKQERSQNEIRRCEYEEHRSIGPLDTQSHSIVFPDHEDAQRFCDKLGGECRGVWGKGSSWRITALSLSQGHLGSGSYLFYRKRSDCVNPYYEYYFEQTWER